MNQNPYSVSEQQTSDDLQSLGPKFDQQLRVMQIIAGTLMMGVIPFLVFVLVITKGNILGQGNPGIVTMVAAGFAGLMIVNHLVIPSIITKARLNQIKSQDSDGQNSELKLASLLSIYRMQLIITLAFLEGAAFFNLVSVMIEHHVISLIAAIVLLGLMAVRFPTRTKVSWWVQDRLRELQM
jgi:hypothetical protein